MRPVSLQNARVHLAFLGFLLRNGLLLIVSARTMQEALRSGQVEGWLWIGMLILTAIIHAVQQIPVLEQRRSWARGRSGKLKEESSYGHS